MAELSLVAKAMFYKKDWDKIPDEEKESCFFIFNRYFSKKYPEKSQLSNNKNIDKVSSMNLWYEFMSNKPYPGWFWSKPPKNKEISKINNKDFNLLLNYLKINKEKDLEFLIENNFDFIKEELKYFKKLDKGV